MKRQEFIVAGVIAAAIIGAVLWSDARRNQKPAPPKSIKLRYLRDPKEHEREDDLEAFFDGVNPGGKVNGTFIQPTGMWKCIGPFAYNNDGADKHWNMQGVVRSVTVDPKDHKRIILGTAYSGMYLSEDTGKSWRIVGENLPFFAVKGIAFSKSTPSRVYAATEKGPIRSNDGGKTWSETGLTGQLATSGNMAVDSTNANVAYYAGERGLYVTNDGGTTWTQKLIGMCWDVQTHPTKTGIAYAVQQVKDLPQGREWHDVVVTSNSGSTFTRMTAYPSFSASSASNILRVAIAVTPAAPNNVYVTPVGYITNPDKSTTWGMYGCFVSKNSGNTFEEKIRGAAGFLPASKTNPNLLVGDIYKDNDSGQCTWNYALAVSDKDPNLIVAGSQMPNWSKDGGHTWSSAVAEGSTTFAPHPDQQALAFDNGNLWVGNDGGLYEMPAEPDNTFRHYTQIFGVPSVEVWGFDQGWKSDVMVFGCYHGPITYCDPALLGTSPSGLHYWTGAGGADAGETFINPGDERIFYTHPWSMVKMTRSGNNTDPTSWADLGATLFGSESIIQHPNLANTLYARSGTKLLRSDDAATTWTTVKDFKPASPSHIEVSYTNPSNVLVICDGNKVSLSTDSGENWTNISPPNVGQQSYHSATFGAHSEAGLNNKTLWLVGKWSDQPHRIMKSTDGGGTWTDEAGTLPAQILNDVKSQLGTDGGVYIAGDYGVWYRDNSMSDWKNYSSGLPKSIAASYLRMNYATGKLRIGSERSIWEAPLYSTSNATACPMVASSNLYSGYAIPFCDHSVSPKGTAYSWSFEGGKPATSSEEKPSVSFKEPGVHEVTLTVKNGSRTHKRTFSLTVIAPPAFDSVRTLDNSSAFQTIPFYRVAAGQYLTFTALSPYEKDSKLAGLAELVVLDGKGNPLPRNGWKITSVDSQENGSPASNILDGNPATIWHTEFSQRQPGYPHTFTVDMGAMTSVSGIRVLQRTDNSNVHIKTFRVSLK